MCITNTKDKPVSVLPLNRWDDCRAAYRYSRKDLVGNQYIDKTIRLLSGLEFVCMRLDPSVDVVMPFQRNYAFLEFGCLLSGRIKGCSYHCNGEKHCFGGGPGQTWLSYCHNAHGTIEYLMGQPICAVLFIVSDPLLDTFLPMNMPCITSDTDWSENSIAYNVTGDVTPEISQIVYQVLQKNDQPDELNRLYLTSKAYEILFHLMAAKHHKEEESSPSVKPMCIYRATQIILENLESPPKLADIAKQSGLCTTSLNAGFRELFGTTVFGFLRRERLAKAKYLIKHENKSASEAAWEVGYASLSSFHRAFYAQHGVTPGYYSKNKRINN